jgi:hypothetical protein
MANVQMGRSEERLTKENPPTHDCDACVGFDDAGMKSIHDPGANADNVGTCNWISHTVGDTNFLAMTHAK